MRGLRFAVAALLVTRDGPEAPRQFRPGGGGGGVTFLVSNKAVQEDLKLSEEQVREGDGVVEASGKHPARS
ncbi:MAG: hypothetical protein U0792_23755 [Gemmataceae bacterium]